MPGMSEAQTPTGSFYNPSPLMAQFMTGGQMGYLPQAQYLTQSELGLYRTLPTNPMVGNTIQRPSFFRAWKMANPHSAFGGPGILNPYNPALHPLDAVNAATNQVWDTGVGAAAHAVGLVGDLGIGMAASALLGGIPGFALSMMLPSFGGAVTDRLSDIRSIQAMTSRNIVGGKYANRANGRGFNANIAHGMVQNMYRTANRDALYNYGDYMNMFGMGVQHGLFDFGESPEYYKQSFKTIRDSMSTLMEVVGSTDFKDIFKHMKRLRDMGVSLQDMKEFSRKEQMYARITGMSHSDLVNTYGSMGAVAYSQRGLNAASGIQMAEHNAAVVRMGVKTGVITNAMLASNGGESGLIQKLTDSSANIQARYNRNMILAAIDPETLQIRKDFDITKYMGMGANGVIELTRKASENAGIIMKDKNNYVKFDAKLPELEEMLTKKLGGPEQMQIALRMILGNQFTRGKADAFTTMLFGGRAMGEDGITARINAGSYSGFAEHLAEARRNEKLKEYMEWKLEMSLLRKFTRDLTAGIKDLAMVIPDIIAKGTANNAEARAAAQSGAAPYFQDKHNSSYGALDLTKVPLSFNYKESLDSESTRKVTQRAVASLESGGGSLAAHRIKRDASGAFVPYDAKNKNTTSHGIPIGSTQELMGYFLKRLDEAPEERKAAVMKSINALRDTAVNDSELTYADLKNAYSVYTDARKSKDGTITDQNVLRALYQLEHASLQAYKDGNSPLQKFLDEDFNYKFNYTFGFNKRGTASEWQQLARAIAEKNRSAGAALVHTTNHALVMTPYGLKKILDEEKGKAAAVGKAFDMKEWVDKQFSSEKGIQEFFSRYFKHIQDPIPYGKGEVFKLAKHEADLYNINGKLSNTWVSRAIVDSRNRGSMVVNRDNADYSIFDNRTPEILQTNSDGSSTKKDLAYPSLSRNPFMLGFAAIAGKTDEQINAEFKKAIAPYVSQEDLKNIDLLKYANELDTNPTFTKNKSFSAVAKDYLVGKVGVPADKVDRVLKEAKLSGASIEEVMSGYLARKGILESYKKDSELSTDSLSYKERMRSKYILTKLFEATNTHASYAKKSGELVTKDNPFPTVEYLFSNPSTLDAFFISGRASGAYKKPYNEMLAAVEKDKSVTAGYYIGALAESLTRTDMNSDTKKKISEALKILLLKADIAKDSDLSTDKHGYLTFKGSSVNNLSLDIQKHIEATRYNGPLGDYKKLSEALKGGAKVSGVLHPEEAGDIAKKAADTFDVNGGLAMDKKTARTYRMGKWNYLLYGIEGGEFNLSREFDNARLDKILKILEATGNNTQTAQFIKEQLSAVKQKSPNNPKVLSEVDISPDFLKEDALLRFWFNQDKSAKDEKKTPSSFLEAAEKGARHALLSQGKGGAELLLVETISKELVPVLKSLKEYLQKNEHK